MKPTFLSWCILLASLPLLLLAKKPIQKAYCTHTMPRGASNADYYPTPPTAPLSKKASTKPHAPHTQELPFFAGNFTKGLEHNKKTGLLTHKGQENYKKLLKALSSGKEGDFNAITYAGSFTFAHPHEACSLDVKELASFHIPSFPPLSSPEAAANLMEVYLMALCRDVSFNEYGTGKNTDANGKGGSLTKDAASYIQALGRAYKGPRTIKGKVDTSVLFRSFSQGSCTGPYISQFLLLPLNTLLYSIYSPHLHLNCLEKAPFVFQDQMYPIAAARKDFGVSFSDFVALQNGTIPVPYSKSDYDSSAKRFIMTGRDLASYMHFDRPYEMYYNALTLLFTLGFPYRKKNFYSLAWVWVAAVSLEALKTVWVEKWRISRVLRPEAFAGLVHNTVATSTNPFNLDSSLFVPHGGIDLLALTKSHNSRQGAATYLLSLAYPEGSPLHPSYPQAHSTVAGACITIIKAFFDNSVKIIHHTIPVKPDPSDTTKLIPLVDEDEQLLTVGSELDKLACNIGMGRNFAGIHYRADLDEGLRLGEQIACRYLKKQAATLQGCKEFVLTSFDGRLVRITPHSIEFS